MGISLSGLSLVTAAAAELGADNIAREGISVGHRGSKAFFSGDKTAGEVGKDSSDSESGWPLPAFCACADGKPPQPQGAPSQASAFSSMWTSAVGISDPEVSSAGSDSLSILSSEELLSTRGASQERLPAVLATHAAGGETEAAVAWDLLGGRLKPGVSVLSGVANRQPAGVAPLEETIPGKAEATVELASLARGGVSAKPAGILRNETDARFSASRTSLEGLQNSALAPDDSAAAELPEISQTKPEVAQTRDRFALTPDGEVLDRPGVRQAEAVGLERAASENGIAIPEGSNDPNLLIANNASNAYAAAAAIANTSPANPAGNASMPPTPAPRADAAPAQLPNGGVVGEVETASTPERQVSAGSEIAFEAEIQPKTSEASRNSPLSTPQRDPLSRWNVPAARAGSEFLNVDYSAQRQDAKAPAERAETGQSIAFRPADKRFSGGDSSLGQHHSGNPDRGSEHTTPMPHASNVTDSRFSPAGASNSKSPAMPAAAHLDGPVPSAPPETGQTARSVALKIQSAEHGAANVVLTDRGGQVHVTVRASDPTLTQSLRGDLGSLASGLQQQGFDVKVWNSSLGSPGTQETRWDSAELSGQDDARGQSRQRHSPEDAEHRHRRPSEWTEEIEQ